MKKRTNNSYNFPSCFTKKKKNKKQKKNQKKKQRKNTKKKQNGGDETAFYHTELRHIIPDKFGN